MSDKEHQEGKQNCCSRRENRYANSKARYLLTYTTNGLLAWFVSHIVYASVSMAGLMDPAAIASHWEGLFAVANVCGFLLAGYVQMKGYTQPSFPGDCKVTGAFYSSLLSFFCKIHVI